MRINVSGQTADLPDDATGKDLYAWASQRTFPGARADKLLIVYRTRFIEPTDRLADLGLKDTEWLLAVESTCMHSSPYEPLKGGYLCGWC
ncbi:MAG: hypothetical protein ACAI25_16500 [Planctomycetota bacterium]